jgi:hypothetical protein
MVVLRHPRGVFAAAAVVAFNLLMFVLAAMGSSPIEASFPGCMDHGRCRLARSCTVPHRTPLAGI